MRQMPTVCPVATMTRLLGKPWTLQIIHHLREPRHFRDLQERLGGISPTLLARRLRTLAAYGLVQRTEPGFRFAAYELTPAGQELLPIIDALAAWSEKWLVPRIASAAPGETEVQS